MLSPLSPFRSLPRLCPHQSHLHTISGLSGLAPKHGYRCTRCAQRKWPPVLIPPLDSLKDPLKPPQTLILPTLDKSSDQQKRPLLGGVFVDTHHTQAAVPNTVPGKVEGSDVKERKEGELTVLSVGRWDIVSEHSWWEECPAHTCQTNIPLTLIPLLFLTALHSHETQQIREMSRKCQDVVTAPVWLWSRSDGRFQVAQIPEQKPVPVEPVKTSSQEQRNSLFGGKPFGSSSSSGIRRYNLLTSLNIHPHSCLWFLPNSSEYKLF